MREFLLPGELCVRMLGAGHPTGVDAVAVNIEALDNEVEDTASKMYSSEEE